MTTHVLLTGATRGIGAAIAARLQDDPIRLAGHGTRSGLAADFSDPAAPARLWDAALAALDGKVDVLINNAGIFEAAPLDLSHDLAFAICPGFTVTGMADEYLASRGGDQLLADIPLGRVANPEAVATIARFCALEAPPSMTGAVLDVNGASYVR